MAHCTCCHYKWRVKEIWPLAYTKQGKECPNCKITQYATFKDRGFILGLGYISGTIAVLIIILFPFIVQLSNEDENVF